MVNNGGHTTADENIVYTNYLRTRAADSKSNLGFPQGSL